MSEKNKKGLVKRWTKSGEEEKKGGVGGKKNEKGLKFDKNKKVKKKYTWSRIKFESADVFFSATHLKRCLAPHTLIFCHV